MDVEAYLRRRYGSQIASIEIVAKEDLDLVGVSWCLLILYHLVEWLVPRIMSFLYPGLNNIVFIYLFLLSFPDIAVISQSVTLHRHFSHHQ